MPLVRSYPEPILLKKAVSSATNIPEDFFELLWADNAEEATMILIADCPWDMIVSSLIDRDFDEELRLTARIVQLCLGDATAATDKIFIHAIQIHDDKMVKIFLKILGFTPGLESVVWTYLDRMEGTKHQSPNSRAIESSGPHYTVCL